MDKILIWFIRIWLTFALAVNAIAIVGIFLAADSFWRGWDQFTEIYSPFNVINFAMEVVLISPALGAYVWLERRRSARQGAHEAGVSMDPVPPTVTNRREAEERSRIISNYGQFLENNPTSPFEIQDARRLPHDKQAILDAICLEIIREPDETQLGALRTGATFLAYFQEGVGDQPLSPLGVPLTDHDLETYRGDDAEAFAERLHAGRPNVERYRTFEPLVQKSQEDISARLAVAEQLRLAMPEEKKREILG